MRLSAADARERFAAARHAYLATASNDAVPHLVPVTFALVGEELVTAVDHKPKRDTDLRRLRNVTANPAVALLVDHYAEDWTRLWWARADGVATVLAEAPDAVRALVARYPQYADRPPRGPVVRVAVRRWSGWAFRQP